MSRVHSIARHFTQDTFHNIKKEMAEVESCSSGQPHRKRNCSTLGLPLNWSETSCGAFCQAMTHVTSLEQKDLSFILIIQKALDFRT